MSISRVKNDVGADIESICGKCGDVWHVVVAKVGQKIVKVQCKQCGGLHRYRPLPGAKSPPKKKGAKQKGSSARSRAKAAMAPEPPPQPRDPSVPPRPYRFTEQYEEGDQIDHLKFGVGIVEELLDQGKMQVYFSGERKVLALAKPASTLSPPSRRSLGEEDLEDK